MDTGTHYQFTCTLEQDSHSKGHFTIYKNLNFPFTWLQDLMPSVFKYLNIININKIKKVLYLIIKLTENN